MLEVRPVTGRTRSDLALSLTFQLATIARRLRRVSHNAFDRLFTGPEHPVIDGSHTGTTGISLAAALGGRQPCQDGVCENGTFDERSSRS